MLFLVLEKNNIFLGFKPVNPVLGISSKQMIILHVYSKKNVPRWKMDVLVGQNQF